VLVDPHEYAPDLDYFIWVLRRGDGDYVVDTGFAEEAALRRGRELLRSPAEALRLIGFRGNHFPRHTVTVRSTFSGGHGLLDFVERRVRG
jgi:hypothetical protein